MLTLRVGPCEDLEEAALEILMEDRQKVYTRTEPLERTRGSTWNLLQPAQFRLDELTDWLSEDQLELRTSREIPTGSAWFLGEYLKHRRGQYGRAYNPLEDTRPDIKNLVRRGMDPWHQLLWEQFDNWAYMPGRFSTRQAM